MPITGAPARLALNLAALGWHILPLSPASKRPLGNCGACRPRHGLPAHLAHECPCLPAGGWCHGVRAATIDPALITTWWQREPRAVPGIAAGPSGLLLVDIDAHGGLPPPHLATGLLPGIDLAAEPIPRDAWDDPGRFRDGRDTLTLLARLRGGPKPWPSGPGHQPVTAATPSGGVHLWYQAPAPNLRQALADPTAATAWPGKSTSKPDGPTASPPAPPPPPAATRSAAVIPPGPVGCPAGSPVRSSAPPPPHHDSPPPRRRCPRPRGPARAPTSPPSSPAAPSSSPP